VDGGTAAAIRVAGIAPEDALRNADSGTALAAVDALIRTGPTGTNVMDVVLAIKFCPDLSRDGLRYHLI